MADGGKVIIKIDGDDKGFKSVMSKTKDIAGKAAKGIAVGVGAAATAIGAIGTQAVNAYADYEQLVGGVETLFKQSADVVQNYANQAYKTAGMSANQYMETVTSFSASLLQSLGGDTAKAAEYGNQAVIDMSDNANKMGTSIEMIQNAYQGFAKQNYTMLDNLKLGYGGTKEEMARLVNDAAKLDSSIQANDLSFANIVKSIHAVQSEMGITGTTAQEAATTIQGSLSMVKASWENLLTGLADPNADIDLLIDNVINSVMTLGENLMPVIQAVLDKIPIMLDTLGGVIMQKIPEVVNTVLPDLVNSASNLISTLANSLNTNADMLGDTALNILMTLVDALISNLPVLLNAAMTLILTLEQGLGNALPELIPVAVDMILQLVDTLLNNIDMMVDTAISLIMGLAEGLIQALPMLIEKAPEIIKKLVDAIIKNAPKLAEAAGQLIEKLVYGIITNLPGLIKAAFQIVVALVKYLKWYITDYLPSVGINIVKGIWQGISNSAQWLWGKLKEWCGNVLDKIKGFFGIHSPSRVMRDEVGKMITEGIAVGIEESTPTLEEAIKNQKQTIVDNYKDMAQAAIDSINDLAKAEEKLSNKLKDFGVLYKQVKVTGGEGENSFYKLADLREQTQVLEKYADTLLKVKERGGVPQEFFEQLRDMSIEDGTTFAKTLLSVNDEAFAAYMKDWQDKQSVSEELSKMLYAGEAEKIKDEITSSFEEFDADLAEEGKENAEAWGQGFIDKIKELMPNIKETLNSAFGSVVTGGQLVFAGAGTSNTYNTTYNITSPNGESPQQQRWALRNQQFLNEQRGY